MALTVRANDLELDDSERAWLASLPTLRLGFATDWRPVSYLNKNQQPAGIASEYLKRLGDLGVRVEYIPANSWQDLRDLITQGKVDIFMSLGQHVPGWVNSDPYVSIPNVIVTRMDHLPVLGLGDLNNLRVIATDLPRISDAILARSPHAIILSEVGSRAALERLKRGEADAFVGNLAVAEAMIREDFSGDLRIIAPAMDIKDDLGLAVSHTYAPLAGLYNRVLQAMPRNEHERIRNNWLSLQYHDGILWKTLYAILVAIALLIIVGSLIYSFYYQKLRREIAKRREVEKNLLIAKNQAEEAACAKANFLATMSHEIRTPMSVILGMLERLAHTQLEPEQRRMLDTVDGSTQMLLQILDDILDVSKIEAGALALETAPFDLRGLIDNVLSLVAGIAQKKNLHLHHRIDPALAPQLAGDPVRLRQILFNLLSNAIKFTEHGEVCVDVHVLDAGEHTQQIRLSVSDTGIGIDPAQQEKLFKPFTQAEDSITRRYGGTGLGLSICRSLVGLMQGRLTLDSEPGQGTRVAVLIELPRINDPAAAGLETQGQWHSPIAPLPCASHRRILVAEDHPTIQELIRWRLEQLGFTCDAVEDGVAALRALANGTYAALITDCHMPRMDGLELARRVRAQESSTGMRLPIIALTASARAEQAQHCVEAGMDDYLIKPVRLEALRTALERWVSPQVPLTLREFEPDIDALSDMFGSREVAQKILASFVREAEQDLKWLADEIGAQHPQPISARLHRMIGCLQVIHAEQLIHEAQTLSAQVKATGVATNVQALWRFHSRLQGYLNDIARLKS